MGKKKGSSSLGKGLIKDRAKNVKKVPESWLHTSELNDGYDWNRLNLRSVTEQSNLDDFLETAELAGTEFTAERLNVKVIDEQHHTGLPSAEETVAITKAQKENLTFLQIPRRPKWDSTTTAEQLNQNERDAFLEWRRQLSVLQEKDHIVLTPFERNLDFWRQLWRVIERSDVIVQIVDARNPLLFRCQDLEKYVKEVDDSKENVILISKADLLTQVQRERWASYFSQHGVRVAFWSAVREEERLRQREAEAEEGQDGADDDETEEEDEDELDSDGDERDDAFEEMGKWDHLMREDSGAIGDTSIERFSEDVQELDIASPTPASCETRTSDCDPAEGESRTPGTVGSVSAATRGESQALSLQETEEISCHKKEDTHDHCSESAISHSPRTHSPSTGSEPRVRFADVESDHCEDGSAESVSRQPEEASEGKAHNPAHLLTGEELLDFFKAVHVGRSEASQEMTTVGMVGYPNVGKSSTINALLREKKVPVSATPGRTKHFQTLFVEPTICLCDCPGLVMPSFVNTKADMYLNGILPIDQMRDFVPPVSLLCQRVPREVLELTYGFNLIQPAEGEDPDRPPTALELLNAHAYVRGFMTHKGVPDCFRSARIVLKDYVNGKLLYRTPPPGDDAGGFGSVHFPSMDVGEIKAGSRPKKSANKPMITEGGQTVKKSAAKVVDESFFARPSTAHMKAVPPRAGLAGLPPGVGVTGKPWKKQKRGKKEKLRRVYGHLDEK